MWREIKGFSNYKINETGRIYKLSNITLVNADKATVSLKADDGVWKNRSVAKLIYDTFECRDCSIQAVSLSKPTVVREFYNIKEAADWLVENKLAITAGKLAAYNTVRNNIKRGLTQPTLYPYVYGFIWNIKVKGDSK